MLVVAIAMIATTGCQNDWEDTFSTEPTAPQLLNNGAIWMTQNTMSESVIWAWSEARFMQGDVTYSLYAQYGESVAQVGAATSELTVSVTKENFHSILTGFVGSPANGSYDLSFYVEAVDAAGKYTSTKQAVKVHAYVDAVSPVATVTASEVVLDMTTPAAQLELLSWEPARLAYGEEITYNVIMTYGEGAPVNVATDLTATSCSKTVDEWNELVVSAGAPEAEASDVKLQVIAYSESYPEGVAADAVTINITTYVATYPDMMYLPGSYQGWDPATAKTIPHSTATKGLFAAYVDLTTADGSDVEFKFAPEPNWGNDFGSEDIVVATDKGFAIVTGTSVGSANIKVPSGLYHIALNKKFNTIEMVQIKSMGLIGGFNGWGEDLVMEYDAATNKYTAVGTFTQGDEFKIRANGDWTYAIGADGLLATSAANCVFEQESGEYKVILDVNSHPYSIKFISTAFPAEEFIHVPGNHQGWTPSTAPRLQSAELNGVYTGFSCLDGEFKFTKGADWSDGEYNWGSFGTHPEGFTGEGGGNITCPAKGFYYMKADVMNSTLEATATSWGIIGPAQAGGWDTDTDMTWDETKHCWTATVELAAGEMKFRANDGWDINVGGAFDNLTFNGGNIAVEAGTYVIDLYLERTTSDKMYCTVTKQ